MNMNIIDIHSKLSRGNYGADLKYLDVMIRLNKRWYEDCRWIFEKMLTRTQKDDLVNWIFEKMLTRTQKDDLVNWKNTESYIMYTESYNYLDFIDKGWVISLSLIGSSCSKNALVYAFNLRKFNMLKYICENFEFNSLPALTYSINISGGNSSFENIGDIPFVQYISEKYKRIGSFRGNREGRVWWINND